MRFAPSPFFSAAALLLAGAAVPAATQAVQPVAAVPVVRRWTAFTDPNEGSFQVKLPAGWKNSGGLRRYSAISAPGAASATAACPRIAYRYQSSNAGAVHM